MDRKGEDMADVEFFFSRLKDYRDATEAEAKEYMRQGLVSQLENVKSELLFSEYKALQFELLCTPSLDYWRSAAQRGTTFEDMVCGTLIHILERVKTIQDALGMEEEDKLAGRKHLGVR
jgi:hypothetical protein